MVPLSSKNVHLDPGVYIAMNFLNQLQFRRTMATLGTAELDDLLLLATEHDLHGKDFQKRKQEGSISSF